MPHVQYCKSSTTVEKNVIEKRKIIFKQHAKQGIEGNRVTSVSEQKSVAAEYTWLAAIVSALATSQLGCGWVAVVGLGVGMMALCSIQLQWSFC